MVKTRIEQNCIQIGKNIKEIRIQNGFSIEQIAISLGISQNTLKNIENGKEDIFLPELYTLSRLFHFDINDITIGCIPLELN